MSMGDDDDDDDGYPILCELIWAQYVDLKLESYIIVWHFTRSFFRGGRVLKYLEIIRR
jgi:hypothetical protein